VGAAGLEKKGLVSQGCAAEPMLLFATGNLHHRHSEGSAWSWTALPAAGGPTLSALAAAGVAQVPVQEHTTTEWMGSGWHVCLRAACAAAESQPATSSGSTRHWLASWGAAPSERLVHP
jgi:hypothetical protein